MSADLMRTVSLENFPGDGGSAAGNDKQITDESSISSRRGLYKVKGFSSDQEKRRKRLLEAQKKKRGETFKKNRHLSELSLEDEESEEMDVSFPAQRKSVQKRKFVNMLMQSEWMTEVPADLESKWFFMPCPAGKRCLVVAHRCVTRAYSYSGKPLARFASLLPGGSGTSSSGQTVLDCVWSWRESTYYVLDVLVWRNQPFLNCETECRFFWLKNHLAELEGITEIQETNKFKFKALPFYPCISTELSEVMCGTPPFPCVMDGVLFYHREAHYTAKSCPLVVWLLPFMLPEVLGVSVSDALAIQCPPDYPGHLEFVHKFQEQNRKERREDYKQRKAASRAILQCDRFDTSMDSQNCEPNEEESFEENCDLELG